MTATAIGSLQKVSNRVRKNNKMSQTNCQNLTGNIQSLQASLASLDLLWRIDMTKDCLEKKSDLISELRETRIELFDPFETELRKEIADKYGFAYIGRFFGAVAWAYQDSDKILPISGAWLIDRAGNKLSSCYSGKPTPFYDGQAWIYAKMGDGNYNLQAINDSGKSTKFLYDINEVDVTGFEESGFVMVTDPEEGEGGWTFSHFLDSEGRDPFKDKYLAISPFSEGLAWACLDDYNNEKLCIIDTLGNEIKRFDFDYDPDEEYSSFSDGVAWVTNEKEFFLYDKTGTKIFETGSYDESEVNDFHEGVAVIESIVGDQFALQKNGKYAFGPYREISDMEDGVAIISEFNSLGENLVDIDGNPLFENYKYSRIIRFCNGIFFAKEEISDEYILINRKGVQKSKKSFVNVIAVNDDGVAFVKGSDGKLCVINSQGETVFAKYTDTSPWKEERSRPKAY